jgi:DNA-binding MarR family transcriptional regulator
MYYFAVDAGELHQLGRRLVALSRATTDDRGDLALTAGEQAVLEDVLSHPGSSVSQIQRRTGFVQSHVSASVARLRGRGLVRTAADAADGRRTRVDPAPATTAAVVRRAARPILPALTEATADPEQAARAAALLDELATLLRRS